LRGMVAVSTMAQRKDEAREWAEKLIQKNPKDKSAYYTAGVLDWSTVFFEFQRAKQAAGGKPEEYRIGDAGVRKALREQHLSRVESGIQSMQAAMDLDSNYEPAMAYVNLLYRLKAGMVDDDNEAAALIAKADEWVGKALATKAKHLPQPGQIPPPAQLDVDGPPPGPETAPVMAPPPPPPPPGAANTQAASMLPPPVARGIEQQAPFWQVSGGSGGSAMALYKELQSKGFTARLQRTQQDNLIRVMVGPYYDKPSLDRAKGELEAAGFQPLRIW
jgi:cell division septation protein DedD